MKPKQKTELRGSAEYKFLLYEHLLPLHTFFHVIFLYYKVFIRLSSKNVTKPKTQRQQIRRKRCERL